MSKTSKRTLVLIALAILFAFPKTGVSDYSTHLLTITFLNITVAVGLWLVVEAGQLSIGHAGFMCIGAYTSALLVLKVGVPFWGSFLAAGLLSGLIAFCIGIPGLRVKGPYFAILTLGFNEALKLLISALINPFGGVNGLTGIPNPEGIGSNYSYYVFSLILGASAAYVAHRLYVSHWGLTLRFIGQADSLAESVGINIMWSKVFIFVLSAIFAGLSGSVFAHYHHYIAPDFFTFGESVTFISFILVGGTGHVWGPIIGTFLLTAIPDMLGFGTTRPLFVGGLLIIIISFLNRGIIQLPELFRREVR